MVTRMKVRAQLHHTRLDGREWRVLRPSPSLDTAVLYENDLRPQMYVDRRAAYQIGVLWLLAARSRHTVIHLPLRSGRVPVEVPYGGRPVDLVLSQHTTQLRLSRWPKLRAALGPATPHTVRLAADDRQRLERLGWPTREERPHWPTRDRLHDRVHADTLFLTGSAPVFRYTAEYFFDLAFNAPGSAPGEESPHHKCSELHWSSGLLVNMERLHVQYRAHWLPHAGRVSAQD